MSGAAALCAACVDAPTGPAVMALPGSGKSFADFQVDDRNCRDRAADRIGIAPGQAAGAGAAIGAGSGLLLGSANGASAGEASAASLQRRYDAAYTQCMYANGNQAPVEGRPATPYGSPSSPPPPPVGAAPPPPPYG